MTTASFRNLRTMLALPVLLVSLNSCGLTPMHKAQLTVYAPHVPNSPLKVESSNGSIQIEKRPGTNVEIIAVVKAVSAERLQETEVIADRDNEGRLWVRAKWPGGKRKNREGCSFVVKVPDADGVELVSSNGTLTADGLGGAARFQTSNGKITLRNHAGSASLRSSNGAVRAENISGDLEADTSNGSITASNIGGSVSATTSNGRVSVALGANSPGPVSLRSSNGTVTLDLGAAFQGSLDLSTSNGSIRLENLPPGARIVEQHKKSARVEFGNSGASSRVKTSNGSIRIH